MNYAEAQRRSEAPAIKDFRNDDTRTPTCRTPSAPTISASRPRSLTRPRLSAHHGRLAAAVPGHLQARGVDSV